MAYLLDTNVLIHALERHEAVLRNLERVDAGEIHIPSVVQFELWYGVAKGGSTPKRVARMNDLMARYHQWLPFDHADARTAGEIRAALEAMKQPIGQYDVMMAGQAMARGLTMVTANDREFRRVEGLTVENWAVTTS